MPTYRRTHKQYGPIEVDVPDDAPDPKAYMDQAVLAGKFRSVPSIPQSTTPLEPPTIKGMVEERFKPVVGELAAGAITAGAPYVAPLAGMTVGAKTGAAAFAPFGAIPAAVGAIGGAAVGAGSGQGINEIADMWIRKSLGQQMPKMVDVAKNMGEAAAGGAIAETTGRIVPVLRSFGEKGMTIPGTGRTVTEAASRWGVPLTYPQRARGRMAQNVGGFVENVAARSPLSRGMYEEFGTEIQAPAMEKAGTKFIEDVIANPRNIDPVYRSHKFIEEVSNAIDAKKAQRDALYTAANKMITAPVVETPILTAAQAIKESFPTLRGERVKGLGSERLEQIVDSILGAQGGGQLGDIRKQLGLKSGQPLPPGFTVSGGPLQQPIMVDEIKKFKQALDPLAYPNKMKGVLVDAEITVQARKLWHAFDESLRETAKASSPMALKALEEAKQFNKSEIHMLDENPFFSKVMAATDLKGQTINLQTLRSQIFNPKQVETIHVAKKSMPESVFNRLKEEYWDSLFFSPDIIKPTASGGLTFNGAKFADRINKEMPVIKALYGTNEVKDIQELAAIASKAAPTLLPDKGKVVGMMVGVGETLAGGRALWNLAHGDVGTAALEGTVAVSPVIAAKMFTSPKIPERIGSLTRRILMGGARTGALGGARYMMTEAPVIESPPSVRE